MTAAREAAGRWSALSASWRDEPRLFVSIVAANAVAMMPMMVLPWTLGSMAEAKGLSDVASGIVASAVLGGAALTSILASLMMKHLDRWLVSFIGVAMAIAGLAGLVVAPGRDDSWLLVPAAIGFGLAGAGANALLACSLQPARMAGALWLALLVWQILLWAVSPFVAADFGLTGMLLLQLACGLALGAALISARIESGRAAPSLGEDKPAAPGRGRSPVVVVVTILLACAAFWLRDSVTWSLLDRRAGQLGIDAASLSAALVAATIIGLGGPAAVLRIGPSAGRPGVIAIGQFAAAAVLVAIALVNRPVWFLTAYLFWPAASLFAWSYMLEIAARADGEGRVAGLCGAAMFVAGALGPLLGTMSLASHTTPMLPLVVGSLSLLTLCLTLFASTVSSRATQDEGSM